eukprot:scaffold129738_cov32-Tisochrysis_lutea.AAC.2
MRCDESDALVKSPIVVDKDADHPIGRVPAELGRGTWRVAGAPALREVWGLGRRGALLEQRPQSGHIP